ncbi:cuticlin-4-like [Centruroides vittatus]|uniref:cuticlin-4-like n=1 Tax=Centruroides vittatus TaxID=120091 RepID=UPI00350F74BC
MNVHIEFDRPFNGIVYSKGYYSNSLCRYVNPGRDSTVYDFLIPLSGCGTSRNDKGNSGSHFSLSNIIIFQNDENYQEIWDRAQSLRCEWTNNIDKFVNFEPVGVDMLDVQELVFSGDQVDCWMEVQLGKGPFAPRVNRLVKIGEILTLAIFIRDEERIFDLMVKSCYAFDSPDFNSPETRRIQLTDADGCPIKAKLVDGFYRTKQTGITTATVIAYAFISAFKFPDKSEVFMACNVNICKRGCHSSCLQEITLETQHVPKILSNASSSRTASSTSINHKSSSIRPFRPNNLTNGHVDRFPRSTDLKYMETNMRRSFNIYSPEDLPQFDPIYIYDNPNPNIDHDVCMSIHSFALNASITALLLIICCYLTFHTCYQMKYNKYYSKFPCRYFFLPCTLKDRDVELK